MICDFFQIDQWTFVLFPKHFHSIALALPHGLGQPSHDSIRFAKSVHWVQFENSLVQNSIRLSVTLTIAAPEFEFSGKDERWTQLPMGFEFRSVGNLVIYCWNHWHCLIIFISHYFYRTSGFEAVHRPLLADSAQEDVCSFLSSKFRWPRFGGKICPGMFR